MKIQVGIFTLLQSWTFKLGIVTHCVQFMTVFALNVRSANRRTDGLFIHAVRHKVTWLGVTESTRVSCQTRNLADDDKPRDSFRSQSASRNMVPFDVLSVVSYQCAILTLSSPKTRRFSYLFLFKNVVTLKSGSVKVI